MKDTGIGIPADQMDRLFQSFSQVDSSTTRQYGGTGLGLPISKKLIELMGGELWVESEAGKGSTFHFSIEAEAADIAPEVYFQSSQSEMAGKRLLIVDDNETHRNILTTQVEAWGMSARVTGSAAQALQWVNEGGRFDAALLDMQMPEMDGLTLARAIRLQEQGPAMPLVILSDVGRQEINNLSGEIDISAYLTQPIKETSLYETLLSVFTGRPTSYGQLSKRSKQIDRQLARKLPLRILVADDNTVNQKMALRILSWMGYRADVAANGVEILEALRRQTYDLVLCDVQMPEMDGLEAARRIREQWSEEERPRIIAMTASAMPSDRDKCLKAGMDDYISKPVRVEDLQAALVRWATGSKYSLAEPFQTHPEVDEERDAPEVEPLAPKTLDLSPLMELRGMKSKGEDDIVNELIRVFLRETPTRLTVMWQSLAESDVRTLQREAHALRGSCLNMGAMMMSSLSAKLEEECRDGHLQRADVHLVELEREFRLVKAALKSVLLQE